MISHSTENGNGVKIKSTSKRSLSELKIVIFRLTPSNGEGNNGEVRTLKCYLQQAGAWKKEGIFLEPSCVFTFMLYLSLISTHDIWDNVSRRKIIVRSKGQVEMF